MAARKDIAPSETPGYPPPTPERLRRIIAVARLALASRRTDILVALAGGERSVGEILGLLGSSNQPSLSADLSLLRGGGLVAATRRGQFVFYALTEGGRRVARAVLRVAEMLEAGEV